MPSRRSGRGTTAPYGPLFLGAVALIVSITGTHLIAGVLLVRALDLAGVVLLAIFVPRLARALNSDPVRATWLAVLSPLVLLELVAAGHNDALMVGLVVTGVTLAVEGRPLAGVALCALAATVKLPALAAVVLIAAAWAWSRRDRARVLVQCALTTAAVALVLGALTGTGLTWLSGSLISTPQKVRLAVTPSTGLGYTAAALLRDLGVSANAHHLESALGMVALGLTVLVGVVIAYRTRMSTLPRDLGVVLLVAALCGPAAWPWYLTWSLALLAAWPVRPRARGPGLALALPALTVVSVFVVKPDGILALPLPSAPAVVAVYAALAIAAGVISLRSGAPRAGGAGHSPAEPLGEEFPPALVESR